MDSDATSSGRAVARSKIYQAAIRVFAENGGREVTVRELAKAAGIARGTIYNNIAAPEELFTQVGAELAHEMLVRTEATMSEIEDPVARIATGMRLFIRRAHEEQDWGRFLVRFALGHSALQPMMHEPPARDLRRAISGKRFKVSAEQIPALLSMQSGATVAAMNAVINGEQTWRDAGSNTAELFLLAGGVEPQEARRTSRQELPNLAPVPTSKRKQS